MGKGGRYLLVMLGTLLLGVLLRAVLAPAGVPATALVFPLIMAVPWLILAWYRNQEGRRPVCPTCDLPLSYRRLGPSHGMWECPALCGHRKLDGKPGTPS